MLESEPVVGRTIPEEIKREVRQASAFGCVICGIPVFQYEHIEDFAQVQRHRTEDITLLCATHHQEKTSGRLTRDVVRRYQAAPANRNFDQTQPHAVLMAGDRAIFTAGTNVFEKGFSPDGGQFACVVIGGETVFGVESQAGMLMLNILLTDAEGRTILKAVRGELTVCTGVWDYTLEGSRLRIRSAPRDINVELDFTENGIHLNRGSFQRPPLGVVVEPTAIHLRCPFPVTMAGGYVSGTNVAISVG